MTPSLESFTITPRQAIGLPESKAARRPFSEVVGTTDHYTTGEELGRPDTAGWVRGIYRFHVLELDWDDIGYHFLWDRFGTIYAGRPLDRIGAHSPGANRDRIGVAFLGDDDPNYQDVTPEGWAARLWLQRELIRIFGRPLDPTGHRDHRSTGCPGDELYGRLRELEDPHPPEQRPAIEQALVCVTDADVAQAATVSGHYRWAIVDHNLRTGHHRLVRGHGAVGEPVDVRHALLVGKGQQSIASYEGRTVIGGADRWATGHELGRLLLEHPPGTESRRGPPW